MQLEDVRIAALVEEGDDGIDYGSLLCAPDPERPGGFVNVANTGDELVLKSEFLACVASLQARLDKAMTLLHEVHADSGFPCLHEPLQELIVDTIHPKASERVAEPAQIKRPFVASSIKGTDQTVACGLSLLAQKVTFSCTPLPDDVFEFGFNLEESLFSTAELSLPVSMKDRAEALIEHLIRESAYFICESESGGNLRLLVKTDRRSLLQFANTPQIEPGQ